MLENKENEIVTTTSDGMTYRKIGDKLVSRQVICHVRQYMITKHLHGYSPKFALLDAPVYRVSTVAGDDNWLATSVNFPDLDLAIEYATGRVIKQEAEKIQEGFKEAWEATFGRIADETVTDNMKGELMQQGVVIAKEGGRI